MTFGRFLKVYAFFFVVICAACGGGGGGGGGGGIPVVAPPTPAPVYTPTPLPQGAIGDVKTIAQIGYGNGLTFDADSGGWIVDTAGSLLSPAATPFGLPALGNYDAIAYDQTSHTLYAANGSTITATSKSGITTFATGLAGVLAMTTDVSGNVYVIDKDHVSEIVGGVPKPITAPGSIPIIDHSQLNEGRAGITFDSKDGALYVANPGHNDIERITTSGAVTTIAGQCLTIDIFMVGDPCGEGDYPGTGAAVLFGRVSGIAYDSNADVFYVTDIRNNQLWLVTPTGTAMIVAGYGRAGTIDANGRAAFLLGPFAPAVDPRGRVYFREAPGAAQYLASYATAGSAAPPFTVPAMVISMPSHASNLTLIRKAPDGSMWALEGLGVAHISAAGNAIEYSAPRVAFASSSTLVVDSAANAWIDESSPISNVANLVRIAPDGTATTFNVSNGNQSISGTTYGPDGNIWFTMTGTSSASAVGYLKPQSGAVTMFSLPTVGVFPPRVGAISIGPDGNMWFASSSNGYAIGRISLSGILQSSIALPKGGAFQLVYDAVDHNEWYLDTFSNVGKISSAGVVSTYSMNGCGGGCAFGPIDIDIAADGTPWTVENDTSAIVHLDENGNATRYIVPMDVPGLLSLQVASNGNVWASSYVGAIFDLNPTLYDQELVPHLTIQAAAAAAKKHAARRGSLLRT